MAGGQPPRNPLFKRFCGCRRLDEPTTPVQSSSRTSTCCRCHWLQWNWFRRQCTCKSPEDRFSYVTMMDTGLYTGSPRTETCTGSSTICPVERILRRLVSHVHPRSPMQDDIHGFSLYEQRHRLL